MDTSGSVEFQKNLQDLGNVISDIQTKLNSNESVVFIPNGKSGEILLGLPVHFYFEDKFGKIY
jgi:hypothetical protein